jgi:two-component system, NtrC family, sensor histidine kinase HydH
LAQSGSLRAFLHLTCGFVGAQRRLARWSGYGCPILDSRVRDAERRKCNQPRHEFDCAGLLVGFVFDRERRQKSRFQRATEKLSSVYEKVQANVEGMKRVERLSALGQLSAGLAHEIRNPLASISGAAGILQRNEHLDPKHAKCIDIITSEWRRLDGLLTNFLDFARPPAPRFQTINLEPVLDSVLALSNHGLRGKRVHCEKQMQPNLPRVEGDPEQLEQVLLNLMINAIEASPDGETVTLSAGAESGKIVLRVSDHGHGVPSGPC